MSKGREYRYYEVIQVQSRDKKGDIQEWISLRADNDMDSENLWSEDKEELEEALDVMKEEGELLSGGEYVIVEVVKKESKVLKV